MNTKTEQGIQVNYGILLESKFSNNVMNKNILKVSAKKKFQSEEGRHEIQSGALMELELNDYNKRYLIESIEGLKNSF